METQGTKSIIFESISSQEVKSLLMKSLMTEIEPVEEKFEFEYRDTAILIALFAISSLSRFQSWEQNR